MPINRIFSTHQFTPQVTYGPIQEDQLVFSLRKKNIPWKIINKLMNQEWQAIHGKRPDGKNEFYTTHIISRYLKFSHSHEEWKKWDPWKYQQILGNWVQVAADFPVLCRKKDNVQRQCRWCVGQFLKTMINITIRGIEARVLQHKQQNSVQIAQIENKILNNLIIKLGTDSKNKYSKLTSNISIYLEKLRKQLFIYMKCKMRNIQVPISKQLQFYVFIGKFAQIVEQIRIHHPLKKNPNKLYRWSDQQIKHLLEVYSVHGRWIAKIRQDMIKTFGVHQKFQGQRITSKVRTFVMLGLRTLQEQLNKIGQTLGINLHGTMIVALTNGLTPEHIEKNMKIIQLFLDRQESYPDQYLFELKEHFLQDILRENRRHWRSNYRLDHNHVWVEVDWPEQQKSNAQNSNAQNSNAQIINAQNSNS